MGGTKVKWELEATARDDEFQLLVVQYLNCLGQLFWNARDTNEWEFALTLLGVRGVQQPGWEPYYSTVSIFEKMASLLNESTDAERNIHLGLWLACHWVEASEPYEVLANLLHIAAGGQYHISNFSHRSQRVSPREKVERLLEWASTVGTPDALTPLFEAYDPQIRNAVFHSDYAVHQGELRIPGCPGYRLSYSETVEFINRGLAYHNAFTHLYSWHIGSYSEPISFHCSQSFGNGLQRVATAIIREGHGLAGVKDGDAHLIPGAIPFRLGRFTAAEMELLDADPSRAVLPART